MGNGDDYERRNQDLDQIKRRVIVVESKTSDLEKIQSGINYALFGVPQDRTSNGMVGEVSSIKEQLKTANRVLVSTLITALVGVAVGVLT